MSGQIPLTSGNGEAIHAIHCPMCGRRIAANLQAQVAGSEPDIQHLGGLCIVFEDMKDQPLG